MKFKSQICTTVKQSDRLLDLGLKSKTADLHYCWQGGAWILHAQSWEDAVGDYPFDFVNEEEQDYWKQMHLPAWSLHRLIEILDTNPCVFYTNCGYDNIIDRIEDYIKEGIIDTRYLEEWCLNEEE